MKVWLFCLLSSILCWGCFVQDIAAQGNFSVQDSAAAVIRSHRTIKGLQENREAVAHELDRAKAGYGPRVDVTGSAGGNALDNKTYRGLDKESRFYGTYQVGVTVTQPIWDGFATRSRVRATEATLDSLNERVFDNATTLGLDGIIAHINILRQRRLVSLAEDNVKRHEEILASGRDRQALGADTLADVSQTEARLARARSTLTASKNELSQAEHTYRRLTGLPVPDLAEAEHPQRLFESEQAVLDNAIKYNPKLRAYMADVRAAEGNKELAEAAFYPIFNLEGGAYASDRAGDNDDDSSTLEVKGTMRWNIFNSGADVDAVRASKARIRQARQVLGNQWDEIKLEVRKTWADLESAKLQHKHYSSAVEYNTQTRDAYIEQFLLGQRSLLDVLDSENELFNSATQAVTMRSNVLVAEYRLHALTGSMLPDMKISTSELEKAPVKEGKPLMDFR